MTRFRLLITELGNAAFTDNRPQEIARILREVADRIERTEDEEGACMDINGNRVGHYKITSR